MNDKSPVKTETTKPANQMHWSKRALSALGSFRGIAALIAVFLLGAFFTPKSFDTGLPIFLASLPAGGFLLVWCDNEEGEDGLHAGFRLSGDGEALVLSSADGLTILEPKALTCR